MQVSDIISRARSLTYNASTTNPADSDIINAINQVQQALVAWIMSVQPDFLTEQTAQISYVAGQQEYALPTTLSQIRLVEVTDLGIPIELPPKDFGMKDFYPVPAEPLYYYYRNGNIGFLPAPYRTASNNVNVIYLPTVADVAVDTDVPGVPVELHPAIVYGVCVLLRERDQQPPQNFASLYDDQLAKYSSFVLRGRGAERRRVTWRP